MTIALVAVIFAVVALIGVPIAFAIGITAIASYLLFGENLEQLGTLVVSSMGNQLLLAIPFYVLAGLLLAQSGVIRPLLQLINLTIGRMRGGMIVANGASALMFGGMTGSGPAEAAALAVIFDEPMRKRGYSKAFVGSLCAVGGTLGLVIPPSGGYIIYALVVDDVQVADLFIAGIVPGIVLALCFIAMAWWRGRKMELPLERAEVGARQVWRQVPGAILGLMAPVIILGGIYLGLTTVTESAFVAVLYAMVVGGFVYRQITLRSLMKAFKETAIITGTIFFILASAAILSWTISVQGWARAVSGALVSVADHPVMLTILVAVIFLVAGLILDGVSMIFVLLPFVAPAIAATGADPIQIAVVVMMAIAVGLITPPMGLDLFTAASVLKIRYEAIVRSVWPMVIACMFAIALVIAFPALVHVLL